MSKLLSCPFCGSTYTQARYMGLPADRGFEQGWRGECCDCGALTRAFDTQAGAVNFWNTRAERTCRIEERNGDWYCSNCGEMVGTCDTASELFIDGNAIELWNYCPSCGARVEVQQ